MKFEWKVIKCRGYRDLQDHLNEVESDNWEVFAVLQGGESNVLYVVARLSVPA